MKPVLIIIAVVFALGLAIPPHVAGQQAARTKEFRLSAEQLGEEIAEWQWKLDALKTEILDPSKIWVQIGADAVVALDEADVMDQIKRLWLLDFFFKSVSNEQLGFERAMWTEQKIMVEMDAAIKATYTELIKQDREIREIKERQAARLREIIRILEKKRADELAAKLQQTGTPQFKPDEADVAETEKEAVRIALGPTAKEENWDTRDIDYVLGYLRKTRTPAQLRMVKTLIENFSGCYKAWNTENARIAAAAKAGNWMPGKRISAGDEALRVRNACLKRHKDSFEIDW
jgi:hypothetical protein